MPHSFTIRQGDDPPDIEMWVDPAWRLPAGSECTVYWPSLITLGGSWTVSCDTCGASVVVTRTGVAAVDPRSIRIPCKISGGNDV